MTTLNPLGDKPFWVNVHGNFVGGQVYTSWPSVRSAKGEARFSFPLYRLKVTPWIPHDGGPCPVGPDVKVRVKTRDGRMDIDAIRAGFWMREEWDENGEYSCDWWRHESDSENDIVAYQIVE